MRTSTLPCMAVILFFVTTLGGREATVRTQRPSHQTARRPTSQPDRTENQRMLDREPRDRTGRLPLPMYSPTPPRHWRPGLPSEGNDGRTLHKAAKPAAMYPASPTRLLLQMRASHRRHPTGRGIRSFPKHSHPPWGNSDPRIRRVGPPPVRSMHLCILYPKAACVKTNYLNIHPKQTCDDPDYPNYQSIYCDDSPIKGLLLSCIPLTRYPLWSRL